MKMNLSLPGPGVLGMAAALLLSPMIALADPPPASSGEELLPLPPPTAPPNLPPAQKQPADVFEESSAETKPGEPSPPAEAPKKSKEKWDTSTAPPPTPPWKPEEKVMRSPTAFGYGIATVVVSSIVVGFCVAGLAGAPYDPKPSSGKLGLFLALGLVGGGVGTAMIYYGSEKITKRASLWQGPQPTLFIGEDRTHLGLMGRF